MTLDAPLSVNLRPIPAPWDAPATDTAVSSSDVDVRGDSREKGHAEGAPTYQDGSTSRRRGQENSLHQAAPCCPSCGANLPPTLFSSLMKRTGSVLGGLFSPGSSMRGGGGSTRAGSLLEFALGERAFAPASQSYQSIDCDGEGGDILADLPRAASKGTFLDLEVGTSGGTEGLGIAEPDLEDLEIAAPPAGGRVGLFLGKWRGIPGKRRPPRSTVAEAVWSFAGALIGISCLAALDEFVAPELDTVLIAASFGASAVLVYAAPTAPLAQPLNLVGGSVLSALTGVLVRMAFQGHAQWLAAGTSVSAAIFIMGVTGTMHPPGGAISLIAVIGGKRISDMGFWFVLFPSTVGPLFLLLVALLVNNLNPARAYPLYWY